MQRSHPVNAQKDQSVEFAPLFENVSQSTQYELVGFSQNHHQVHWTAVTRQEEKWYYCDDSQVRDVTPDDNRFKNPASYMVYKRKT